MTFQETAVRAARKAGEILRKGFHDKEKGVESKEGNDLVTKYDHLSEQAIVEEIKKDFPDHNIITEEKLSEDKGSKYSWIIDPLDGTHAFTLGMSIFMVGISIQKNNETIFVAAYNPPEDLLFTAEKGKGAFLNGERIHVSKNEPKNIGFAGPPNAIPKLSREKHWKNVKSCIYGICSVARGETEVFFSREAWIWDYAPALIVQEAGGKATMWDGSKYDPSKGEMLVTNGIKHEEALKLVRKLY